MWLTKAGGIKVFTDVRSGKLMGAAGLEALLVYAGDGDTLAVVRLDRLGRGGIAGREAGIAVKSCPHVHQKSASKKRNSISAFVLIQIS